MDVVIQFSEPQMSSILNVLNKRKWEFKLHTWVPNVSKYSKNSHSDAAYWVVCWKPDDSPITFKDIDESDQRYEIKNIYIYKLLIIYYRNVYNQTDYLKHRYIGIHQDHC